MAAHPYQVKLVWHARAKTDLTDARKLADLLRTNLLSVVWGRSYRTSQEMAPPGFAA